MSKAGNVRVKPTKINIGGKEYLIKYDFNAFIELEDIYGSIEDAVEAISGKKVFDNENKPVMDEVKDKDGNIEFELDGITPKKAQKRKFMLKPVRDFLWCGMLADNKDITKDMVTSLLSFADFQSIVEKLTEALNLAMPAVVKEDDESKN